jgi:hypothetical protein
LRQRLLDDIADDAALEQAAEDAALIPMEPSMNIITFDPLSYESIYDSPTLTSIAPSATAAAAESKFKLDDPSATIAPLSITTDYSAAAQSYLQSGPSSLTIDTVAVPAPLLPAPFAISATVIAAATVAPLPPAAHYVSPGPLAPLGTVVTR